MEFSLKAKPLLIISYHPVQYGIIPNKFAVEGKLFSRRLAETGLMVFELVIGNGGSFIVFVSMIAVAVVSNIGGPAVPGID